MLSKTVLNTIIVMVVLSFSSNGRMSIGVQAQVPSVPWSICYPSYDVLEAQDFCRSELLDCGDDGKEHTNDQEIYHDPSQLECVMRCDAFADNPWDCELWGMVCVENLTCLVPEKVQEEIKVKIQHDY